MLKEKIIYDHHLPIKVTTAAINNYPMHFHDDLEVMYVLEGSVKIRYGQSERVLSASDVFVFNNRELHGMSKTDEANMVMMLQINTGYFKKYYENLGELFFTMTGIEGKDESVETLRTLMASIMMEMLQKGPRYEENIIESVHNLITCFITDFTFKWTEVAPQETRQRNSNMLAARLHRMMSYIYENYSRKLTLNEIAEKEGLSLYYLSHMVKESAGMSFQDLLSYVRVEASEDLVLNTNKRIGAIAEEVGFSAVRYYIKHFEQWLGMPPLEYRKKYGGKIVVHRSHAEFERCAPVKIEESIRKYRKEVYDDYIDRFKAKPVIINVDVNTIPKASTIKPLGLAKTMERDVNRILAEPFLKFKDMGEKLIDIGSNYAITTKCAGGKPLSSLSIVLYNVDETMAESLNIIETEDNLLNIVKSYDTQTEFLLRFRGFNGTYRVLRYRLEKDSLVKRIGDAVANKGVLDARERFINELSAEPSVYNALYKSSKTMSLRSAFSGIGIEIIFMDQVDEVVR